MNLYRLELKRVCKTRMTAILLAIALEDAFKVRFEGIPPFKTVGDIVAFLDKNRTV